MGWSIDAEDEQGFKRASEELLDRFADRLDQAGAADTDIDQLVGTASLLLDWKWGYADGELVAWEPDHVHEFLLDWCPRKLSFRPEDSAALLDALKAWLEFLDATDLAAGSRPVSQLLMLADILAPEFLEEMGDPANFGLAKSLWAAAVAEGVDTEDPDAFKQWMSTFNDRPEEERRRILPDSVLSSPPPAPSSLKELRRSVNLPPVALPDDEARIASAGQAPILVMFDELHDFVGDGRKLTQTGNLTLADARVLVDRLGTGDQMDRESGGKVWKTRSSADLGGLRHVFAWAKKAGVVRVERGQVKATTKWAKLADPETRFQVAADAVLALGPLQSQRDPDAWLAWPEVNQVIDEHAVELLLAPYAVAVPVPVGDVIGFAVHMVNEAFTFGPMLTEELLHRRLTRDVADFFASLERAGVCETAGSLEPPPLGGIALVEDAAEPDGVTDSSAERIEATVTLTPAGKTIVHRWLSDAGFQVSEAGHFAHLPAGDFLLAVGDAEFPIYAGELDAWLARRNSEEAARDMAEAARQLADPGLRNMAFAALGKIGVGVSEGHVRGLADEQLTAGWARCWLVDHHLEPDTAVFDASDAGSFVDVLAKRLIDGGSEDLIATLGVVGSHDDQVRTINALWRSPSSATLFVLETIGKAHPAKIVAKAARKAVIKHRSWLANGQR